MRKAYQLICRVLPAALLGACAALIVSEVFPPCSIAFWRLAFADEWADGYIGPVGSPAVESLLTARIAAAPTAPYSLRLLYKIGNAQGKAYALQGLQIVAWNDYCRLRDDYALSDCKVTMHAGCTVMPANSLLVADCIESGRFGDEAGMKRASSEFHAHIDTLKAEKNRANQRPDGTSAKAPPSNPSQGAAVPHP